MRDERIAEKALEDYPEEYVPDGDWKALKSYEYLPFGIVGIDAEERLLLSADDGSIRGVDLDTAYVEKTRYGRHIRGEDEYVAHQQHPQEYMLDRDTSDWVWVSPRFRYLTEPGGEFACERCDKTTAAWIEDGDEMVCPTCAGMDFSDATYDI